jgi:hypothetical protein
MSYHGKNHDMSGKNFVFSEKLRYIGKNFCMSGKIKICSEKVSVRLGKMLRPPPPLITRQN